MLSVAQSGKYYVREFGTDNGIGYVNISVLGKNRGTVTDQSGRFNLDFGIVYDNDSLRFTMIGYEPVTITSGRLQETMVVFLHPKTYSLPELHIAAPRGRETILGTPVVSESLKSGFSDNTLGAELGIKVYVKKRTRLSDINFNIGTCSYDSVTYRLNIYRFSDKEEWENILNTPIYLSFTKKQIKNTVTLDLKDYNLYVEGQLIFALELYRDPGEGKLLFLTQFFTGTTWHRQTASEIWTQSPGQVGIYLRGRQVR